MGSPAKRFFYLIFFSKGEVFLFFLVGLTFCFFSVTVMLPLWGCSMSVLGVLGEFFLFLTGFSVNGNGACLTKKNELVRNNGEKRIADFLYKNKVRYLLDHPFSMGKCVIHPDFFLPDYDLVIEFWDFGMHVHVAREVFIQKMEMYRARGVRFLLLNPTHLSHLKTNIKSGFKTIVGTPFPS